MKKYYTKKYFEKRDILINHLAQTIQLLMEKNNFKTILDVGCGSGKYVKFLNDKGFKAMGCDNSAEAVRMGQRLNKRGTILRASATKLPFKNSSFEMVVGISIIEHLTKSQVKEFIAGAKRVLKKGGILFVVTPNFATPIRLIQQDKWFGYSDPTHINFYTPLSLSKELKKLGFTNFHYWFKSRYSPTLDWEFPDFFAQLPTLLKRVLVFLFFSSPIALFRNSFWVAAQK